MKFCFDHEVLPREQFGFLKGRSAEWQLLSLAEDWNIALDKKKHVHAVFLDAAKAFDRVDHSLLLQELSEIGVNDVALCWFRSYLSNRPFWTDCPSRAALSVTSSRQLPSLSGTKPTQPHSPWSPVLANFQLGQHLRLETDASVLHGLSYALWQPQGDHLCLLECGSRFLSDAESRYAVIKLECLAVVLATKKCGLFLLGTSFELVTDHRPLVPILNDYSLDQIKNPRLQRLVLKLRPYQRHGSRRKGTDNAFADPLSRHPVDELSPEDEYGEDPGLSGLSIRACLRHNNNGNHISDLHLHEMQQAVGDDPECQQLIQTAFNSFLTHRTTSHCPLWNGRKHVYADHGLVLKS